MDFPQMLHQNETLFTKYCEDDHVRNVNMDMAGCTYGRNKKCAQNFRRSVIKLLRSRWGLGASSKFDLYVNRIYVILTQL